MGKEGEIWWRSGVIYQVYPRSYQDTNGDGVGDLPGITSRLDYLKELGVDAAWCSPFYPSPMADFGYDVADYTDVDPLFGTMADFDALLAGCHARGLKLILDFVPNHTSNQHPWFQESRSSTTSAKRDWYLWRDAAPGGGVPNNWMASFGGSGWEWDEATRQYYFHSFLKEQPDLNWWNPEVKAAIFAAMRFWLAKGVDGFRMDVLWLLIKDDQFRNNPVNPEWRQGDDESWSVLPQYTANRPETLAIVEEMRRVLQEYGAERVLIGEIYLPVTELMQYYGGPQLLGAQMPFNFHLIQSAWQAGVVAELITRYEAALPAGAWPNWVMGNHDQHRIATRIGAQQARVAAVLLLTLRGTPTMYYGDELGMEDARITPDEVRDPAEKRQPGLGLGRDPERAPMLWNQGENAGFTQHGVKTWLPLPWGWQGFAVEVEDVQPDSLLSLYRRLLALRRALPALHAGDVSEMAAKDGVLRYVRSQGGTQVAVLLNMTDEWQSAGLVTGTVLVTALRELEGTRVSGERWLRGGDAMVVRLD